MQKTDKLQGTKTQDKKQQAAGDDDMSDPGTRMQIKAIEYLLKQVPGGQRGQVMEAITALLIGYEQMRDVASH
jgi:hypothetical protein